MQAKEVKDLMDKHGIDLLSAQLLILLGKAKQGEKIEGLDRIERSIQAGVDEFHRKIKIYTDTIADIRVYMSEETGPASEASKGSLSLYDDEEIRSQEPKDLALYTHDYMKKLENKVHPEEIGQTSPTPGN